MITPFKERVIDFQKPVHVYRCLIRKGVIFSIRQGGLVVAHGNNFTLINTTLHINESGKQRAIKTGNRNVHAYAKGILQNNLTLSFGFNLYYNPYSEGGFFHTIGGEKKIIAEWPKVSFNSNGVFLN